MLQKRKERKEESLSRALFPGVQDPWRFWEWDKMMWEML